MPPLFGLAHSGRTVLYLSHYEAHDLIPNTTYTCCVRDNEYSLIPPVADFLAYVLAYCFIYYYMYISTNNSDLLPIYMIM